jgi:hypothetical protein
LVVVAAIEQYSAINPLKELDGLRGPWNVRHDLCDHQDFLLSSPLFTARLNALEMAGQFRSSSQRLSTLAVVCFT